MTPMEINAANFQAEVLESKEPVLIDLWATWCGPCRMLSPLVDEIAEQGLIKVGKVNVDENEEIAVKYGVEAIPMLMIFKNGEVAATSLGYIPMEELTAWVEENK